MNQDVTEILLNRYLDSSDVVTCNFCNVKPVFENNENLFILKCPKCHKTARGYISCRCIKEVSVLKTSFKNLIISWKNRNENRLKTSGTS